MKKKYLVVAAASLFGLSSSHMALAVGDGTGLSGSPHDFTDGVVLGTSSGDESWNWRAEICRVCHSPHDKQRNAYRVGLLWNRQLSTATYEQYTSATLDGDYNWVNGAPTGRAKMCLSCHDNTVALQQFDSYSDAAPGYKDGNVYTSEAGTTPLDVTGTFHDLYDDSHFVVGQLVETGEMTLAGTHPISIEYRNDLDDGLNPTNTTMGSSGTIADVLDNGLVQCSSCHDVHNRRSVPGTELLRTAQTGGTGHGTGEPSSELCLVCHNK